MNSSMLFSISLLTYAYESFPFPWRNICISLTSLRRSWLALSILLRELIARDHLILITVFCTTHSNFSSLYIFLTTVCFHSFPCLFTPHFLCPSDFCITSHISSVHKLEHVVCFGYIYPLLPGILRVVAVSCAECIQLGDHKINELSRPNSPHQVLFLSPHHWFSKHSLVSHTSKMCNHMLACDKCEANRNDSYVDIMREIESQTPVYMLACVPDNKCEKANGSVVRMDV